MIILPNGLHHASAEERKLYLAYKHMIAFGKLFLPGDFMRSKTPEVHYILGAEFDSDSQKPAAFILSRESAKTTLTKCAILQDFCFAHKAAEWGWAKEEEQLFHVWVSKSQTDSYANMEYIRINLEFNKRIIHYFGNQRGKVWNIENIVTVSNQKLQSFSTLKSVRGQTWADVEKGTLRLSRAFIDDAETESNTKTEAARKFIKNTIMNAIFPAIEKNKPRRRMFLTGTPVHYDSMAQNLMDDWTQAVKDGETESYPWRVHVYGATQPDMEGGVLWHSFRPRHVLDTIKAVYERSPEGVAGYYQEYELEVQTSENATWSRKHIQYHDAQYEWDEEEKQSYIWVDKVRYPVNTFLGCDPATDIDTIGADFSVIMIIATDAENRKYVLEYVRNKYMPTAGMRDEKMQIIGKKGVADYLIELGQKYHINNGRVEDVAMTRSVFKDLNNLKRQLNAYDVLIAPHPPGGQNKHNRIHTFLNTDFTSGLIYIRKTMYDLENEIIKFGPKMAHDDTVETLYYACLGSYRYKGSQTTKLAPLPDNLLEYKRKKLEALRARNRKVQRSWMTM